MARVCVNGHLVEGTNENRWGQCKECQRARNRVYQEKQKALNALKPKLPYRTTIYNVLLRLVLQENGCWIWPGKKRPDGYGIARVNGKDVRVHRAVYEHFCGPVPEGLVLDHVKGRCSSRACCNFEHLEPVTFPENLARQDPAGLGKGQRNKTHCTHGHPLSGENLIVNKRTGFRCCKFCMRQAKIRHRERLKNG